MTRAAMPFDLVLRAAGNARFFRGSEDRIGCCWSPTISWW